MKFFVPKENISNDTIVITGTDVSHISFSLRARPGEVLIATATDGNEYECIIEQITKDAVYLRIVSSQKSESELPVRIHLYQALPKGEKAELIVQKSVELGVYDITFILSERCIVKVDSKSSESKRIRYEKIAKGAAEQCGRGIIPAILPFIPYREAVDCLSADALNIFCYEGKGTISLKTILEKSNATDINLFIGPEGGWSNAEFEYASSHGCISANLGKRILRCETAPLFSLSCINYHYEM